MPPFLTLFIIIFVVYAILCTVVVLPAILLGSETERQLDEGGWQSADDDMTDASRQPDPRSRPDPGSLLWKRLSWRLGIPADRLARFASVVLLTVLTTMANPTHALHGLSIPGDTLARYASAALLIEAAVMVRAIQAPRRQR
jgi:hypothetical protein